MKETNTYSAIKEAAAGATPGTLLKAARQEQGLSVVDMAARLCLSVQVIEDMERDDYSHMSAKVYARGHVISYAHLLGIPEARIVTALANVRMEFEPVKATGVSLDNEKSIPIYQPLESSQQRSGLMLWGSILVLVILIGLVLMWWRGPVTPPAPSSKVTPVVVTPASDSTVSPPPQQPLPAAAPATAPAAPVVKTVPVVPMPLPAPTTTPHAQPANKSVLQPSEFRDAKRPPPGSTVVSSDSSADLPPPRASDSHP